MSVTSSSKGLSSVRGPQQDVRADTERYTIQPGDTLSGIARALGLSSWRELMPLNPQITDPNKIQAGRTLNVPRKASAPAAENAPATAPAQNAAAPATAAPAQQPAATFEAQPAAPLIPRATVVEPGAHVPAAGTPAVTAQQATQQAVTAHKPPFSLPKVLNEPAWKAITKGGDLDKSVPLGGVAEARIAVSQKVAPQEANNPQRLAYNERAKADGKDVAWLQTAGSLGLSGDVKLGENASQKLEGSAGFSLTRPYAYDAKSKNAAGLATTLARNTTVDLPINADKARAVEQGSTFTVNGKLSGATDVKTEQAGATVNAARTGQATMRFLGGDKVEVTLDRGGTQGAKANAQNDAKEADGTSVKGSAAASMTFDSSEKFMLDLSKPGGREAYDRLVTMDGSRARDLAAQPNSGVVRSAAKSNVTREMSAATEVRTDDGSTVKVSASTQKKVTRNELTGDEIRSRRTQANLAGATTLESGTGVSGDVKVNRNTTHDTATGQRTAQTTVGVNAAVKDVAVNEQLTAGGSVGVTRDRKTDTKTGADIRATGLQAKVNANYQVNERLEAAVTSGISTTMTRNHADGSSVRTGTVNAGVDLRTEVGEGTTLGFKPSVSKGFEFKLPAGSAGKDIAAPLDAEKARALPEGASFTLRGTGTVGVTAENGGLSASATREGNVSVEVKRGAGSLVEMQVDVTRTSSLERGAEKEMKAGKKGTVTVGYTGETTVTRESSGTLTLDLDKAQHRAAYDAALKGDVGPAQRLAGEQGALEEGRTWTRTDAMTLSTTPVEWAKARLDLKQTNIDPTDERVTGDANRTAYTEAAKADGKDVRWVERGGLIEPGVGAKHTFAAGAVGGTAGFSATGLVEFRELRPMVDGRAQGHAGPALKSDDAMKMSEGAEFMLHGKGTVSGTVGVQKGVEYGTTGVKVGASVGVTHEQSLARELTINAKKLEGTQVQVTFTQGKENANRTDFTARAGVDVETAKLIGAKEGSALAKLAGKADKPLEQHLSAELQIGRHRSNADQKSMTFTVDLATEDGKKAYDALMRGDPSVAAAHAGKDGASGVQVDALSNKTVKETGNHAHLAIGGNKLFLAEALRRDTTTVTQADGTVERMDESLFSRKSKGLFSKQDLAMEAVRVRTAEDPQGKSFFRLRYTNTDGLTTKGEMRELQHLGESLGAVPAKPVKVEEADGQGLRGVFSKHGKTSTEIEVFMTEKGLQNLRSATPEQAMAAYGAHAAREQKGGKTPAWADPATAREARTMLEQYDRAGGDQQERNDLHSDYWRRFKRNIYDDAGHYENAKVVAATVGRMRGSDDPAEWNRAFADMGKKVGMDFHGSLAALNGLAGTDEILVHRYEVKGKAVEISMVDEGLLTRPKSLAPAN